MTSTPPTPATEDREAVALAMLNGKRVREGWPITTSIPEGFIDADEWRLEAQDAISALAPIRAAEILAAERERDALREALREIVASDSPLGRNGVPSHKEIARRALKGIDHE